MHAYSPMSWRSELSENYDRLRSAIKVKNVIYYEKSIVVGPQVLYFCYVFNLNSFWKILRHIYTKKKKIYPKTNVVWTLFTYKFVTNNCA